MPRSVTYAFGGTLGGSGIGKIAGHATRGADRASLLDRAISLDADGDPTRGRPLQTLPLGDLVGRSPWYYPKDLVFDLYASRTLDSPDLFHGWNNMCLRSLRTAADSGAVTVVERASSHPTTQREIVGREFEEYGVEEPVSGDRTYRRAKLELQECDTVFVPSDFVYDSFLDQGFSEDDVVKIPFGVDTESFTPPADPGRPDGEFTALFVGQLSLRKGIQYLLPAWDQADVDGTLRFAGSVHDSATEIVDEYRDDPSVEFLGWVDDMHREFQEANAFVFPSVEEGSALVSYEAMASGLPSIVTPNVGSLVEDGVHGCVVPPRDPDAVAAAIEKLAADVDLRREMGTTAREKVEPYTWEAYGDRVAAAYRELLD
jgi:glycosyltransferase involved in cell wall biosynthesis